jgi:pimeloyl-ACP methyl ester carboxylesterase
LFDHGEGAPVVVIPGVQGRWEWMGPALRALAWRHRTISYSLANPRRFDDLVDQLDAVLDKADVESAAICGVSFGGLVALRYAAVRPDRTQALVVVSTPSPSWRPNERQASYLSRPWLSTPAFVATAPARLWPEIQAAIDTPLARAAFAVSHVGRILSAPAVPAAMAARVKRMAEVDWCADCARVQAPTLVVTGEEPLDRVVPASGTREYARLIAGARCATLSRTGHIGFVTQPDRFAGIVSDFVNGNHS